MAYSEAHLVRKAALANQVQTVEVTNMNIDGDLTVDRDESLRTALKIERRRLMMRNPDVRSSVAKKEWNLKVLQRWYKEFCFQCQRWMMK